MEDSSKRWQSLALTASITFVVAVASTIGTLFFFSASPSGERLRSRLGLEELKTLNIATTKKEKVIIEESSAIIEASKKASQSVVSITGKGPSTRSFFGFPVEGATVAGTGFIVTADGLIATNKHVIEGAQNLTVTTYSGKSYEGKVAAQDPTNDLALVKVEASGLPVAEIGDSDALQVGQWVIAIGNALGELQNTVTVGVVSAKERAVEVSSSGSSYYGLIQTDAAINQGNSGGPLVNLSGQIVGVNTMIAGNAENIGFAIPSADLSKDLESYRKNGKIVQPYLGIRYQPVTKALAKSLNLSVEQGALLVASQQSSAVAANSPAEKAGLKAGDIVTKINDDQITETMPLVRIVRKYNPGDEVTLTIIRDGSSQTVKLTLGKLE